MKIDLAVIGQGTVSPAGVGLDTLFGRNPISAAVAQVGCPDRSWPVFKVDQKDPAFARWQKEPRLRRASPISLYLVEAAEQALRGLSPAERKETGLIVAYHDGCLAYSRRFFQGIVMQGQRSASPALFPETVFNSPVSHVAAVLGLNGAAYALVGDEAAWIAGIKTASVWLRQGRVKRVLVLGAEEFDPIVLDAYESAHWLNLRNPGRSFLPSEGAAGILVRLAQNDDRLIVTQARDGLIYRSKKEAAIAAEKLWRDLDPQLICYPTAQHHWLGQLEEKHLEKRPQISTTHQPYLGEAYTASAAWHTLRALGCLSSARDPIFLPIWGLNHQLGSLEFEIRE